PLVVYITVERLDTRQVVGDLNVDPTGGTHVFTRADVLWLDGWRYGIHGDVETAERAGLGTHPAVVEVTAVRVPPIVHNDCFGLQRIGQRAVRLDLEFVAVKQWDEPVVHMLHHGVSIF